MCYSGSFGYIRTNGRTDTQTHCMIGLGQLLPAGKQVSSKAERVPGILILSLLTSCLSPLHAHISQPFNSDPWTLSMSCSTSNIWWFSFQPHPIEHLLSLALKHPRNFHIKARSLIQPTFCIRSIAPIVLLSKVFTWYGRHSANFERWNRAV